MIIGIVIYPHMISIFERNIDEKENIFFFYENRKRLSYRFPFPDSVLVNSIDDYFS